MTAPEQLSLTLTPREQGHQAANACEDKATRVAAFNAPAARAFILKSLEAGPVSGEDLVEGMTHAGIRVHDLRATGPVFSRLAKEQAIECLRADLPRRRGHGTSGGKLWALVKRLSGASTAP